MRTAGGYGIIVEFPRRDGIGWVVGAEFPSRSGGACARVHSTTQLGKLYSKIRIVNEFQPRNDTTLEFTIPAEGFLNQPVISCKSMETSLFTTPSLVVKRSAHHIDGGRIVLIKANNTDIDMDAIRSHFTFTLPEGCTLDLSNAREIAIHVPSRRGTIISFK